jgi:hypothetical protein
MTTGNTNPSLKELIENYRTFVNNARESFAYRVETPFPDLEIEKKKQELNYKLTILTMRLETLQGINKLAQLIIS